MSRDRLLASLFDGRPHPLAPPLEAWLASSRRFAAFLAAFDTKIRKKLRTTREGEPLHDLRLELETAYLLLRERSLVLAYEPGTGGTGRAPDFAATFGGVVVMVEVARLRADPWRAGAGDGPPADAARAVPAPRDGPPGERRFAELLCRKLGQLQPQHLNLLVAATGGPPPAPEALHAAMVRLQRRAEAGDPGVVGRNGLRDRGDFFRRYERLSAVLVRGPSLRAEAPVLLWDNPRAKRPLPSPVRTALLRSHAP